MSNVESLRLELIDVSRLEMILGSSPAISQLLDRENAPIVLLRTVETLNLMAGRQ